MKLCKGMIAISVAKCGLSSYSLSMKFRVLIEPDEDGVFVAECPVLPGCVSQGKTRDEAIRNIQDAIRGYLHSLEKQNEPIPSPVAEEIVEVPV
jgi:antitoxin HicB